MTPEGASGASAGTAPQKKTSIEEKEEKEEKRRISQVGYHSYTKERNICIQSDLSKYQVCNYMLGEALLQCSCTVWQLEYQSTSFGTFEDALFQTRYLTDIASSHVICGT